MGSRCLSVKRDYSLDTMEAEMVRSENRDRASYTKLETRELEDVKCLLGEKADQLETAELTVRRSAGIYTAELRPTDESTS